MLRARERLRGRGDRGLPKELDSEIVRNLLYTFSDEGGDVKKTLTTSTLLRQTFFRHFVHRQKIGCDTVNNRTPSVL